MIYKFSLQDQDRRYLQKSQPLTVNEVDRDFNNLIVKKPWGYEYLVFQNEHVAIWMLHIVRKRKTSMHCHPAKTTSLVLFSGKADFITIGNRIGLNAFDSAVIDCGVFHSTEASNDLSVLPQSENGIWIMEIETPPHKHDLVRIEDAYGRQGKSYEGSDNMVENPKDCLHLELPSQGKGASKKFLDYVFCLTRGINRDELPDSHAIICAIARDGMTTGRGDGVRIGEIFLFKDFWANFEKNPSKNEYTFLIIEKEIKTMRVADYIFSILADIGVRQVFAVSGGAAMHLLDAVGKNPRLEYIATHHEQAAAMAAEGYSRIAGRPGVALVTSGPGGTNAITGVCGAWVDSIPTVFISGQVTCNTLLEGTGLRQFGIQESDIVTLVGSITKYAVTVKDPMTIRYHLEKAITMATTGRPGPVWLDIPLDVQSQMVNEQNLTGYDRPADALGLDQGQKEKIAECVRLLKAAKRPVLIIGYGIRLARAENEIGKLIEQLKVPVVSSWTASDLIATDSDLYVGRSGIMGDRGGNFAVQNADLLLIIGSRMSIPQVGYNFHLFAREARKIVVDIDRHELEKPSLSVDLPLRMDAKAFITELLVQIEASCAWQDTDGWLLKCRGWKRKYPVALPEYAHNKDKVNSFYFVDVLSRKLDKDAIVVTDMGTSFTCTMQTFHVKKGQRLFTSSGHASMGFGLPGAIGACFGAGKKKTICISGDGGLQMNIQELQTMVHYRLPIILFVVNNKGYLSIKLMQQNHFGNYVGSEASSGVTTPDMMKIAYAYGIDAIRINDQQALDQNIDTVLAKPGPFICEIMMPEDQPLIPRTSSLKKPDGKIISRPLEDLYPFLDREEFMANMMVKPVEPLK